MRYRRSIAILFLAAALPLLGQSATQLQNALTTQANLVKTWMADEALVSAVKAHNAKSLTRADVQKIEKEWLDGKQEKLSSELMSGPCADRLRKLITQFPSFEHAAVMDSHGVVVCATFHVSDYYHGDDTMWQRAFNQGKGAAFVDRPRYDAATGKALAQVAVPVLDGANAIGAISVGIDTHKLTIR